MSAENRGGSEIGTIEIRDILNDVHGSQSMAGAVELPSLYQPFGEDQLNQPSIQGPEAS